MQQSSINSHLSKTKLFVDQLSPAAQQDLENITTQKHFKKGDYLLREGDLCRYSFWIKKGAVRKYYTTGNKDISTALLFEDEIAVSLSSYALHAKCNESMEAIADTIADCTSYYDFEFLKHKHPQLVQLDMLLTEHYAIWMEERMFRLNTMTATQRYHLLLVITGSGFEATIQPQGTLTPLHILLYAILFFGLSLAGSAWWSKKFKQGPLEMLMRKISG
jgi:CRP-like cAMP-binding protein